MYERQVEPDVFEKLKPNENIIIDGVTHPYNILTLWSEEKLALYEIYKLNYDPIPTDHVVVSEGREFREDKLWVTRVTQPRIVSHEEINAERDRRVALGFPFNGKMFDSRVEDQKRINGAASLAHISLTIKGKQPGDLYWHDGAEPFGWIAQDNSIVTMDAVAVMTFGAAAARWESLHVFAARNIKDMDPIPLDYKDDKYWPTTADL